MVCSGFQDMHSIPRRDSPVLRAMLLRGLRELRQAKGPGCQPCPLTSLPTWLGHSPGWAAIPFPLL